MRDEQKDGIKQILECTNYIACAVALPPVQVTTLLPVQVGILHELAFHQKIGWGTVDSMARRF